MGGRKKAIVLRRHAPSVVLSHITARANPRFPQRRQSTLDVPGERLVAPRSARIIDAHRLIRQHRAAQVLRRRQGDLAHWHPQFREELTLQIHLARIGERRAGVRFEFEGFAGGNHKEAAEARVRSESLREWRSCSLRRGEPDQVQRVSRTSFAVTQQGAARSGKTGAGLSAVRLPCAVQSTPAPRGVKRERRDHSALSCSCSESLNWSPSPNRRSTGCPTLPLLHRSISKRASVPTSPGSRPGPRSVRRWWPGSRRPCWRCGRSCLSACRSRRR